MSDAPRRPRNAGAAAILALGVVATYAFLNRPTLEPDRFWNALHPDQAVMTVDTWCVYEGAYPVDFPISADPSVARLYNPGDKWLLYRTYRATGRNLPLAFILPALAFLAVYVFLTFLLVVDVTRSRVLAAAIAVASTQWFIFVGDGWGLGLLEHGRADAYLLVFVVAAIGFALRARQRPGLGRQVAPFVVLGLAANLHPVGGVEMCGVLILVCAWDEWWAGRPFLGPAAARLLTFGVASSPALYALLRQRAFTFVGRAGAATFEDFAKILVYKNHVLPDAVAVSSLSRVLVPVFLTAAGVFAVSLVAVVAAGARRRAPHPIVEHALFGSVSTFLIFIAGISGGLPFLPGYFWKVFVVLLLGLGCLLDWRRLLKRGERDDNTAFLRACAVASLALGGFGSLLANAYLVHTHAAVRLLEASRVMRFAWLPALVLMGGAAAAQWRERSWSWVARAFVIGWTILFAAYIHGVWESRTAPIPPDRSDVMTIAEWARRSTPTDALFALTMKDNSWAEMSKTQLFKARSRRGMVYSYDAQNLLFTRPDLLGEARRRQDAVVSASTSDSAVAALRRIYGARYVIVPAARRGPGDEVFRGAALSVREFR